MEKDGSIKNFGGDCFECFICEMMELEVHMKDCFKSNIELNTDTIIACVANRLWLSENQFKIEDGKKSSCYRLWSLGSNLED